MKYRIKQAMIFFIAAVIPVAGYSQINALALDKFLNNNKQIENSRKQEIRKFYGDISYRFAWINNSNLRRELLDLLGNSPELGLSEKDYQYDFVMAMRKGDPSAIFPGIDSLSAEIKLTEAALHFTHDLFYGNMVPAIGYNGLDYSPACLDIAGILAKAVAANQLSLLYDINQNMTGYDSLKKIIARYNKIIADSNFREQRITSSRAGIENKALLLTLFQLGFIDSVTQKLTAVELKDKIKGAQKLFNLLSDAVLRTTSLEEFNVPLAARLKELNKAINTIRWLSCISLSQKVIVVNIPSATLLVYDAGKVILESRIIVGKRSTPTPTLCSKVTEVILYPYWMVPRSIAVKELLPSIKRNIGFLDDNGYQLINQQGRIVNPGKVNWAAVNASNFSYIIRQSTGCDNALGLIKLDFNSPYSVYLHDTPNKSLFGFSRRYYSHGCIRVEKANELGHLVLRNNGLAIDTLTEKGCLYNQAPVVLPADEIIPVFVLYNTAWVDAAGRVSFSEDIYRKNRSAVKRD